jgi:phenylpyruvate tautomerase PptA (4-oxalocrotonate tautomerase family)
MPYVDIKVAGELKNEQKNAIAKEIATTLEKHAGKPVANTYITFTEIPRNSWAKSGELLES